MPSSIASAPDAPRFEEDEFLTMANGAGLNAVFRFENTQDWQNVLQNLPYVPVAYSEAMIDYQMAYVRGETVVAHDVSLIFYHDNRPCGMWPLSVLWNDGWKIGSPGGHLLRPIFSDELGLRAIKRYTIASLKFVDIFNGHHTAHALKSNESFMDEAGLSEWHMRVMQQGGVAKLQHELFVSLNLDINDIKSRFRQSYKSLITSGERLWQVGLMEDYDELVWGEFRELHFSAAGRSTRSALSWELQHKAIRDGNAFLVHLRDQENRMVGGGFFQVTRDEGLYAVGAYDRSLFSRPLGHVVQFYAIREMKRRGLKWYKIGYRPYPGDEPEPSPKEIAIGEFKDGFASHIFPRYQLVHGVVSKF